MSLIILVSIAIRLVAMVLSIVLLWRVRDRRMAYLTVMMALMAIRQTLTLTMEHDAAVIDVTSHVEELPGLGVSVLSLLAVFYLGRFLVDRKQAEETLRRSEQRHRSITDDVLDTCAVGMLILDAHFRVVWMNQALGQFLGLSREDMIGKDERQLVRESIRRIFEDPDGFSQRVIAAYDDNTYTENFECHVLAGHGREERWLEHYSQPIRSGLYAGGRIEHYYDITELKRAQQAVQCSSQRLSELADEQSFLLENMRDFVYRHDKKGVFYYLSPAVQAVTGYTVDEWKKHYTTYMTDHPDNAKVIEYTEGALQTGRTSPPYLVELFHKNGSRITLEVGERPYFDKHGHVAGIVGVARDVTDRKKAEQERDRLIEQLRQSQKMEALGHLAGGVAHDFNNLLTAILGNTEMLLAALQRPEGSTPRERVLAGLEQVRNAGERAASLTSQLLAFSRKQVSQPQLIDPGRATRDMEALLRRLIGEHIEMEMRVVPDVKHVVVDEGQFQQVLMNLVLNAADAMPRGGTVRVHLANTTVTQQVNAVSGPCPPGDYVVLTVSDDGDGMTPETKERIFEPFFTTKPVGKGTGLGLATVYGTVSKADGSIIVDSEPGRGATFKVYLPAARERLTPPADDGPITDVRGHEVLLLCEDERLVRDVNCQILRGAGYTVLESENGRHALDVAARHDGPIDLLITDVVMPEMNGRELADALQRKYPNVKTLFVSGYTSDLLDAHRIEPGQAEFLEKPYRPTKLLQRVRCVLDAGRQDLPRPSCG